MVIAITPEYVNRRMQEIYQDRLDNCPPSNVQDVHLTLTRIMTFFGNDQWWESNNPEMMAETQFSCPFPLIPAEVYALGMSAILGREITQADVAYLPNEKGIFFGYASIGVAHEAEPAITLRKIRRTSTSIDDKTIKELEAKQEFWRRINTRETNIPVILLSDFKDYPRLNVKP
ncbi:hypothetical protein J4405_00400 [Candidatus Woesearchaeota archaeon]|nr:hypothetical protein [Candidatus Woesearchaeota archaeon]